MLPTGNGNNLYLLGTSVGLMSTTELNGNSTVWEREAVNSIGTIPVDMVRVRPIDGYIGVATHGNGIYEARVDAPLQARLQLIDIRCESGTTVLETNIQFSGVESEFDLRYEWFFNGGSLGPDLNSSGISTSTEGTYQVRVTNAVTGESDFSNEIVLNFSEANAQWCSGNPVASIEDLLEFNVYPNPVTDQVTIQQPFNGNVEIRVMDMGGRVLHSGNYTDNQIRLNMSDYPSGAYLLLLRHDSELFSRKIIKK